MSEPKPAVTFEQLTRELADELEKRCPEGVTYVLVLADGSSDDYFIAGDGHVQDALETALQELEDDAAFEGGEVDHGAN